jgi:hypothetical protein
MKGIIYKIVCNETGEVYYGSTHTSLSQRMSCHLSDTEHMCASVQILLRNNYTTSVVKEIEYENNSELLWEERRAIEADPKAININVPIITNRERQDINNKATTKWRKTEHGIEYTKAYSYKFYHENKEECLAKNRAYRQTETGKAGKAKSHKKYREGEHREELLAKKREYHHANREAIAEKSKAYREANVKAIQEKKKAEYEKARENGLCDPISCQCGGTFTLRSKTRHIQTKKHQNWLKESV